MRYIESYHTDIGTRRKSNQDSLALLKARTQDGEILLAVMCDGMGGHAKGELASKTAVMAFRQWFYERLPLCLKAGIDASLIHEEFTVLGKQINRALVDYGAKNASELGTTLTAFLFYKDSFFAGHVGDSRGYEISDNVYQITRDHSLVAQGLSQGMLTYEEARLDPRKNILLETVGVTEELNMDFIFGTVKPLTAYCLCSDGFWHHLSEAELKSYLSAPSPAAPEEFSLRLHFLTEMVKGRGETDNISSILVMAEEHSPAAKAPDNDRDKDPWEEDPDDEDATQPIFLTPSPVPFDILLDLVEVHTQESI